MKSVKIEKCKKNEFVTLKPDREPKQSLVYLHKGYNRFNKRYELQKFDNINHYVYKKRGTIVYINFTF